MTAAPGELARGDADDGWELWVAWWEDVADEDPAEAGRMFMALVLASVVR